MVIGPSSFAPEPIVTLSSTVGWRLPVAKPVPPSVTPWWSVTSSPICAVSPITTPEPWSMNSPMPIRAAGWISMPVVARTTVAIARGASGMPAPCSAWAMRWASSACTPGHVARISAGPTPRAAGSRSRAAVTSRVTSLTTRAAVPRPNIDRSLRSEERRRDVPLARVGQDGDDPPAARLGAPGDLLDRPHRRAARDPGQDPLAAGQRAGGLDRRLVAHRDHLVEEVAVEHVRHEARADALDAVRTGAPARQHGRARRLDGHDAAARVA